MKKEKKLKIISKLVLILPVISVCIMIYFAYFADIKKMKEYGKYSIFFCILSFVFFVIAGIWFIYLNRIPLTPHSFKTKKNHDFDLCTYLKNRLINDGFSKLYFFDNMDIYIKEDYILPLILGLSPLNHLYKSFGLFIIIYENNISEKEFFRYKDEIEKVLKDYFAKFSQLHITIIIKSDKNDLLIQMKDKFKINAAVFSQLLVVSNNSNKSINIQKGNEFIFGNKYNLNLYKFLEYIKPIIDDEV